MAETRAAAAPRVLRVGYAHSRPVGGTSNVPATPAGMVGMGRIESPSRPWFGSCRSAIDGGSMKFEEIVAEADQRPFLLDPHEPSPQELAKSAGVFDLPKHGFHDRLASRVDA